MWILIALIVLLPLASLSVFGQRHGLETVLMETGAALMLAARIWQAPRMPRLSDWPCFSDWPRRGPLPWLFALLLWNGASIAFALDKRLALSEFLQMGAGVTVCWATTQITDSQRIKCLLDTLIGMTLIVSLAAVLIVTAAGEGSPASLTLQNRHLVWNATTHLGHLRTQISGAMGIAGAPSVLPTLSWWPLCLPLLIAAACSPTNPKRRFAAGAAALASVGALVLTTGWQGQGAIWHWQRMDWPEQLLWLAALAAFFVTGVSALRRLPKNSLRPSLLVGAMAGVPLSLVWHPGPTSFFFWLLLGLGMACAGSKHASILQVGLSEERE